MISQSIDCARSWLVVPRSALSTTDVSWAPASWWFDRRKSKFVNRTLWTFVSAIGSNWNQLVNHLEPLGTTCSNHFWKALERTLEPCWKFVKKRSLFGDCLKVVKSGPKRGPNSNAGKWGHGRLDKTVSVERKLNRLRNGEIDRVARRLPGTFFSLETVLTYLCNSL